MLLFGRKLPKAFISLFCPGTVLVSFLVSVGAVWQLAALPEHRMPHAGDFQDRHA